MMIVRKDCLVVIDYKVFSQSTSPTTVHQRPHVYSFRDFCYKHGHKEIFPVLEEKLEGKRVGERVIVTLNPEGPFGFFNPQQVFKIRKENFYQPELLELDKKFLLENDKGKLVEVRVIFLDDEYVHLDGNHPLSNTIQVYDIQIKKISLPRAQLRMVDCQR